MQTKELRTSKGQKLFTQQHSNSKDHCCENLKSRTLRTSYSILTVRLLDWEQQYVATCGNLTVYVAINFPLCTESWTIQGPHNLCICFRSNSNEYLTDLPISTKFNSVINHTELPTEIAYILAEVILRNMLNSIYCLSVTHNLLAYLRTH